MTLITITLACIGILAMLAFLAYLGRHLAMRPPLEGAPPASWLARVEERG